MQTDNATPELMQKTLDLFRLVLFGVFQNERASEVCISVRPEDRGATFIAVATDCDAFEQLYEPVGNLKAVISDTCRTLAVICRDRAVVHRGAVSEPVCQREIQHDLTICSIGAELRCSDPGLRDALVKLVEALMPPPNVHLEVQGRHVHSRAPLQIVELSVGDDATGRTTMTGELHNLPQKLHELHDVQPIILVGGIPIGRCELPYQFNITAGLGLKDAETMLQEIGLALEARMPSPLKDQASGL